MMDRPESPPERPVEQTKESAAGIAWGSIVFVALLALVVVFTVQNTDQIPVRFLWLEGSFSLALVIIVTAAVAVILAELLGAAYRSRRRRRQMDRQELRRLRGDG
jgi:uncharacterized integral membrane protein